MSLPKFLISKRFLIHIASAIGLVIVAIIITLIALSVYTHHGESRATPDFSGLTEMQFIDLVQEKSLRYKIIDSVHFPEITPGVVLDQNPKPGSFVKENRTIFFTINAYAAEQVPMPQLLDFSLRNAQAALESYGIRVHQLIYIPSEYAQLILGQHYQGKPIKPGTMIPKGSYVDLLVGQGLSNEKTSVPELFGMTLEQARNFLQKRSLNVDAVIYDGVLPTQRDSMRAVVWKQSPKADRHTRLSLGASLDIWLTNDSSKLGLGSGQFENEDSLDSDSDSESELESEF